MLLFMTDDKDLTLQALANRVFFKTQEIEDVLEMIEQSIQSIFQEAEDAKEVQLNLGGLTQDSANATITLTKENYAFGISSFFLRRNNGLINGHCTSSDMFTPYNLNSREGLMEFAVKLYEDAAQNLASNEAAKRFEERKQKL